MNDNIHPILTRPGLGRGLVNHDERSRNFPVRAALPTDRPRDRSWRRGHAYDQGQSSQCVAYTGKGILNTLPLSHNVEYDVRSEYDPNDFYIGARQNDEWPGEQYEGTSGLGLCRFLTSIGLIKEYRWCFGLQDVLLTVSHIGPVGLGIWWYNDMFYPDSQGYLHPTGMEAGGHEIEIVGVDVSEKCVILCNSWGVGWGDEGHAKLSWTDLDTLLENEGDAFVVTA